MEYFIYTDGACSGNPGRGGWAAIGKKTRDLMEEPFFIISGYEDYTTNQRMEMKAIIEALNVVDIGPFDKVTVFTDSAYCFNCFEKKWYEIWEANGWITAKKEPVKNKELWEELIKSFKLPQFNMRKVKGHADDHWNNLVDGLAVQAKDMKIERREIGE